MNPPMSFADVLEAVEQLSQEDQASLVEIVRRRTAEIGHKRVLAEAEEAQREFKEGRCRPATADEIMDEILS